MLTLAQSCQKVFLLGAEKANEFDRLNREVARMHAGYDYQFDDIGHTYHSEDYDKKKMKDKQKSKSEFEKTKDFKKMKNKTKIRYENSNPKKFKNKKRAKPDYDYNEIYSGELPENKNYLENPVTETRDDELITSDTVLSDDEKPVILPDNPRDTTTIKLNPTRTKQRQTEIKNLKSKQEKTDWKILKYEPKETTYDISPKMGKIRKPKNNPE